MDRRTIELSVAGHKYRVLSSAGEAELRRLAETVSTKLGEVAAGRATGSEAMFLAAMALAHEVEAERARRTALERRARELLQAVLKRIDAALKAEGDGGGEERPVEGR